MKTIGEVLDKLLEGNALQEDNVEFKKQPNSETSSPWFVQGLLGCGGWIAALFFFGFTIACIVITLGINENQGAGIVFGILGFILVGASSQHKFTNRFNQSKNSMFIEQFRLVVHIGGHLSLLTGINLGFELWNFQYYAAIFGSILLVQCLIGMVIYPDVTLRFLATLGIVIALNLIAYDSGIPASLSIIIGLMAFGLIYCFGGLMPAHVELARFDLMQVFPYALSFGLFGTIIHELSYGYEIWAYNSQLYQPYISSVILLVLLLWQTSRLLGDYNVGIREGYALAILGVLLIIGICTLNTPGILASILLTLLAYRRRNRFLLGLAYLGLACFIFYFYYSLSFTLLEKSIILIATGLVMLAGRFMLKQIPSSQEGSMS